MKWKKTRETPGGIHAHRRGKKHPGVRVIRPTNRLFDGVLDYRRYRLIRRHKRRSGSETCKVKDHMRAIQTGAPELRCDESDPLRFWVFYLVLSRNVRRGIFRSILESLEFVILARRPSGVYYPPSDRDIVNHKQVSSSPTFFTKF